MTQIRDIPITKGTFEDTDLFELDIGSGDSQKITGATIKAASDPAGTATSEVAAHNADTTGVHGIADTSVLETEAGAQAKADAAQAAAEAASDPVGSAATVQGNLDTHEADTTSVHGIADTADLLDQSGAGANDVMAGTGAGTAGWVDGGVASKSWYEGETKVNGAAVTYEAQDVANVATSHEWATTTPVHVDTMTADTTFTFGATSSGLSCSIFVQLFGAFTPTLPTVTWVGAEPTYAAGTAYTFWTHDGGTSWYAQGAAPA